MPAASILECYTHPERHIQIELPCLDVLLALVAAVVLEVGLHVDRRVPALADVNHLDNNRLVCVPADHVQLVLGSTSIA